MVCWRRNKQASEATFELRYHIGQVILQCGISVELKAHVIVCDSGECLRRIDAPLVQDAVDAKCCGGKNLSSGSDKVQPVQFKGEIQKKKTI